MPSSSSQYDPENRFMKCAMEHKMELKGIDSGNRFERCVTEARLVSPPLSPVSPSLRRSLSDEREFMANRASIPVRENRSDSGTSLASTNSIKSVNKYPNSKLRSKQDIRLSESPTTPSPQDLFEDNFPSLSPKANPSPCHSPKAITHSLSASCLKPKTPIMLPLRSPKSEKSPIRIIDSVTSLSLQGGKLITKEIVTVVEEPPPLTITPSKWSDLLRTSAK
jgi:hypothetical protein